ncbi:2-dehydropantoate 2-reductase [Paenibacillus sp. 7124]|uniref:2-dehydropantoate 2-reductase n=1 Tax=Paenibacillus apii TaxID=1850370 RepID=A0A6M1PNW8_9BACL|nr:2-dehydropantoate 2-reductase [Paenibacillus apii]NGM83912.1 2-dehydropantoate 2-reductase [Paenibacillus apii]
MKSSPRIAVLGAGAMGSRIGAHLFEARYAVVLYDSWKDHVAEIQRNGLRIVHEHSARTLRIKAANRPLPGEVYDYVLLLTKSGQTEEALAGFRDIIGPDTHVVSLQNGIAGIEILPRYIPKERILVGVTTYSSDLLGPGAVQIGGSGITYLSRLSGGSSPAVDTLEAIFNAAGFQTVVSEDAMQVIWEKLAFNASINPVTALTRLNAGEAGTHPLGIELMSSIVGEVAAVGHRLGINVRTDEVMNQLRRACEPEACSDHLPSMLQDVLKGRKTEIEALNGAVIRLADDFGMDIPYNRALYQMVKMLDEIKGLSLSYFRFKDSCTGETSKVEAPSSRRLPTE